MSLFWLFPRFVLAYLFGGFIMLFLAREEGQGLLEYGLVLVLVAVVIAAVLTLLGPQIGNIYSRLVVCIPPTAACTP